MKKVLVVDDDELIRKMMRRLLEKIPIDVIEAEDGEKGLKRILTEKVDLVITDYQMPRMDGLAMLNQYRKKLPHLPCILVSGNFGTIGKLAETYFLKKPFKCEDLTILVKNILGIVLPEN